MSGETPKSMFFPLCSVTRIHHQDLEQEKKVKHHT